MSGPATATVIISSNLASMGAAAALGAVAVGAVALGVAAVEATRIARENFDAALAEIQLRAAEREAQRQARLEAQQAQLGVLHAEVARLEGRLTRLAGLVEEIELPAFEARREALRGADAVAWSVYAQELATRTAAAETLLAASAGQKVQEALATISHVPNLNELLQLYLAQRQALRREADLNAWQVTVTRILSRLDLPSDAPVPPHLETLARAVILAETPARAELLGNELRLAVQRHRAEEHTRNKDAKDAIAWLQLFPEAYLPAPLNALLQEVAAGLSRLDAESRAALEAQEAQFQIALKTEQDRAAAIVLERSLQDLGYQVEAIDETLFSEGGVIHFQRPGWEGYYVRLRANTQEKTFNFNVVRANTVEENSIRQQQDFMAEERWCAEFPKLMETLAARGITLNVTRRLPAGELPVQAVPPERLPDFSTGTQERRRTPLKARTLPTGAN